MKYGDIVKVDLYGDEIIGEVGQDYFNKDELCIGLVEHSPAYLSLKEADIISIVTKEQFDSISYKVKE